MTTNDDAVKFLIGRLDAVTGLCAAIAAQVSPATCDAVLQQCAALREQSTTAPLSAYKQGYLEIEQAILAALKQVADAEKIRSLSGDAKH